MHDPNPRIAPTALTARRAFLAGAVALALPSNARAARFTSVILDPGHGGRDNGARWGGVSEKTLTLDTAKRVQKILTAKGINTALTRTRDTTLGLEARAAKANRYRSAIFVSIHFNAHLNRSITGIETFYMSSSGYSLASRIQGRLLKHIKTKNRGLKKSAALAVLNKTRCTAALVECGFISNSWERGRCNTSWYRQLVAKSIAEGIIAYR